MSEHLKKRLKEKGWTSKELGKLSSLLKKVNIERSKVHKIIEAMLFWIGLAFMIISSLALCFTLILLFIFLKPIIVYIIAGIMGLIFGMLFEVGFRNIDWIETKHHYIGGVIILFFITLNLFLYSPAFVDRIPLFSLVQLPSYGTVIIGIVFSLAFFVPFAFHKITTKRFY